MHAKKWTAVRDTRQQVIQAQDQTQKRRSIIRILRRTKKHQETPRNTKKHQEKNNVLPFQCDFDQMRRFHGRSGMDQRSAPINEERKLNIGFGQQVFVLFATVVAAAATSPTSPPPPSTTAGALLKCFRKLLGGIDQCVQFVPFNSFSFGLGGSDVNVLPQRFIPRQTPHALGGLCTAAFQHEAKTLGVFLHANIRLQFPPTLFDKFRLPPHVQIHAKFLHPFHTVLPLLRQVAGCARWARCARCARR